MVSTFRIDLNGRQGSTIFHASENTLRYTPDIGFTVNPQALPDEPVIIWQKKGQFLTGKILADAIYTAAGALGMGKLSPTTYYNNTPELASGYYDHKIKVYNIGQNSTLVSYGSDEYDLPEYVMRHDMYYWLNLACALRIGYLPLSMKFARYPSIKDVFSSRQTVVAASILKAMSATVLHVYEGVAVVMPGEILDEDHNLLPGWPVVIHLSAFNRMPSVGEVITVANILVENQYLQDLDSNGNVLKQYFIQTGKILDLAWQERVIK